MAWKIRVRLQFNAARSPRLSRKLNKLFKNHSLVVISALSIVLLEMIIENTGPAINCGGTCCAVLIGNSILICRWAEIGHQDSCEIFRIRWEFKSTIGMLINVAVEIIRSSDKNVVFDRCSLEFVKLFSHGWRRKTINIGPNAENDFKIGSLKTIESNFYRHCLITYRLVKWKQSGKVDFEY